MTANSTPPDIESRLRKLEAELYNVQRERRPADSTLDNCPTGMIAGFPSGAAAQGWIPMTGQTITAADYPALHRYLVGAGLSTTLPDWADRFAVGAGNLYAWTSSGGSKDAIVVSHTHTGPAHTHAQNVTAEVGGGTGTRTDYDSDYSGASAYPQGINTDSAGTGATGSTGSSSTNANLPPYRGLYWCIRT